MSYLTLNLNKNQTVALIKGLREADLAALSAEESAALVKLRSELIEEEMVRVVTVVCRERESSGEPILITMTIKGSITEEKVTKEARAIRAEELGPDDSSMQVWVDRLDPVLVIMGECKVIADFRYS